MAQEVVPNMEFIHSKRPDIITEEELFAESLKVLEQVDIALKAKDVEHLLLHPMEGQKVFLLEDILKDELKQKEKALRSRPKGIRPLL